MLKQFIFIVRIFKNIVKEIEYSFFCNLNRPTLRRQSQLFWRSFPAVVASELFS